MDVVIVHGRTVSSHPTRVLPVAWMLVVPLLDNLTRDSLPLRSPPLGYPTLLYSHSLIVSAFNIDHRHLNPMWKDSMDVMLDNLHLPIFYSGFFTWPAKFLHPGSKCLISQRSLWSKRIWLPFFLSVHSLWSPVLITNIQKLPLRHRSPMRGWYV